MLTQSLDKTSLKKKSKLLENSTIEAKYVKRLEDLVYKVFKDNGLK